MNRSFSTAPIGRPTAKSVGSAAFLLTAFMVVQKLLALTQQVLIGRITGLGEQADAFYVAQTVPLLVGAWIMFALSNTLVPLLGTVHPQRISGVLTGVLMLLGICSLGMMLFPGVVIGAIGHGLAAEPARAAEGLLRRMAMVVFLMGVSGILNAQYYRKSEFLVPSVGACLLYAGPIAGASLEPWLGIASFAWGFSAGAVAQVALLSLCRRQGGIPRPLFDWHTIAGFSRSFVYILAGSAVTVLCLITDRMFSSSGPTGSFTAVTMASSLMTLPSSLVVTSLCSALLPALVELRREPAAFAALAQQALGYTVFLLGPATWILLTGGNTIVDWMFHAANVDRYARALTGDMLAAYSLGILAIAFKDVMGVVYIALGRTWIPMAAGAVILAVSIALKAASPVATQPVWIAVTTSAAMWAGVALLVALRWPKLAGGGGRFWTDDGWKLGLTNALFGGLAVVLRPWIRSSSFFQAAMILGGLGVAYLATARLLRFPATAERETSVSGGSYPPWLKRLLDLAVAAPVLVLSLPVMAACAAAVRVFLGSPVLYRQERTGLHGNIFVLLKFRTLRNETMRGGVALSDDDRVTRLGRLLRKTSLDELPQLWHVVRGQMSLVGPRPLLPQYLPRYTEQQRRRHECKPGITGWAQVQGRNAITWERRFELDVWYVDHRSLWIDLVVLAKTVWVVMAGEGTSEPGRATMSEFQGTGPETDPNR